MLETYLMILIKNKILVLLVLKTMNFLLKTKIGCGVLIFSAILYIPIYKNANGNLKIEFSDSL